MLETLARRGEVVLIELDDVDLGPSPTIRIKRPSDINRERRLDGASLKTRGADSPHNRIGSRGSERIHFRSSP